MKLCIPVLEFSCSDQVRVRVNKGVGTYEAMTPQCGRSVVQTLVVRVDIGVMTYEAMTPQCGRSVVPVPGCQSGYRSGDL